MYISKSNVTLNMNNIGTLICISIRVTRTILVFIFFSEGSAVIRSKMDIFIIFEIQNQRSILESIESFDGETVNHVKVIHTFLTHLKRTPV